MSKLNLLNTISLPDILPVAWKVKMADWDTAIFRNLSHFKHSVGQITQIANNNCGVSYEQALRDLQTGKSQLSESKQASIRDMVRQNLFKRGLVTEEVYEQYKYADSGTQVDVDVAKYASGDPDCVITPTRQYVDYFYELYISCSYSWNVSDEIVMETTAKLLAAVEELERKHIFIKVTLVFPANNVTYSGNSYFSMIPVFSHKETKSVGVMSSVLNSRLLRKFYFALLEDHYGDELVSGYGTVANLPKAVNMGDQFDEVAFFESIMQQVGIHED